MSCNNIPKWCKFPGSNIPQKRVYEGNGKTVFNWMYVPDKPGEIINNGKLITFWITPKFTDLWYSFCYFNEETAINSCYDCIDGYTNKKNSVFTGIIGKEQSEANGLGCYGANCPYAGAAVCGSIFTPTINTLSPSGKCIPIQTEYNQNKSIKYIKVQLDSHAIVDYNSFMYVLNHTYDGQNKGKFIPRNVALHLFRKYCESNPEKDGCGLLKLEAPELYNDIVNNFCHDDKLTRSICKTYCTDKNTNCDQRIQEYCKKLGPKDALKRENSELCGCFMGNDFYKGYFDEIRKRYNFPITAPPSHVCYFDYCSTSNIKPYFEKQNPTRCPDVLSCFQNANVTINSTGQVETGDIIINQSQVCQQAIQRKCKVQEDCKTVPGSICTQGICKRAEQSPPPPGPPQPPQQESCKVDKDCTSHSTYCVNSRCKKLDKEQCLTSNQCPPGSLCVSGKCIVSPTWNKTIIIISIIVAILTTIVMLT